MEEVIEKLKRECLEKEIRFIKGKRLEIVVGDYTEFIGEPENPTDFDLFTKADTELAGFYVEKIVKKVAEKTGISEDKIEAEIDADYGDFVDVYTPTLYAKRLVSVKIGDIINLDVWTYKPLKEVLKTVEQELS